MAARNSARQMLHCNRQKATTIMNDSLIKSFCFLLI
jgi:hypothetical protein